MNNYIFSQKLSDITSWELFEECSKDKTLWESFAHEIISLHEFPPAILQRCEEGTNIVFYYGDLIIKIFPPFHEQQWQSERLALKHLYNKLSVPTPELKYEGRIADWPYLIMTRLSGILLEGTWESLPYENKLIIIKELGLLIHEVHNLPIDGLDIDFNWNSFLEQQINNCMIQHKTMQCANKLLSEIPKYIEAVKPTLFCNHPVLLTGEYTPMNFLIHQTEDIWHISGLFDFGDVMLGLPQYDLLGPGAFLIQGNKKLLKAFLLSYGYKPDELNEWLSHQLTALMLLHQYSDLDCQLRIDNWQAKITNLKDLENLMWGFN